MSTIFEQCQALAKQDQAEAAELQSWLVGNARSIRPVARVGLMGWALAALKANPALAELHVLEEVCAFYANDEDSFNRKGGEPYGSIPTEVGMKARQARERFIEREEGATATNTSGKAHCPNCAVCHTSEETCVIALKRFNSLVSEVGHE
ncbi:hypothetical protein AB4P95_30220 (plasmid) [Pseudomonas sp. A1437]|uniref:hypothetical protein n=1 Tax=Pseudomonas sp. A1437 TaxID=3235107 RepID=UPI003782E4A5